MQVKESVNAANLLIVGNQTGQSLPKPNTDAASTDFSSFLANAGGRANATAGKTQPVKETAKNEPQKESKTGSSVKPSESGRAEQPDRVQRAEQSEKSDRVQKADLTEKAEVPADMVQEEISDGTSDLTAEETEALLEAVGQLLQNLMEQFGLSPEEFAKQLESFGMSVEELFTADGLKGFFLQMNQAEVSDLIVDENLNQELKDFLGGFQELLDEFDAMDLTDTVDLEALITGPEAEEGFREFPEAAQLVQKLKEEPQVLLQQSPIKQSQPVMPEGTEAAENPVKEPQATVVENKQTGNGQQEESFHQQADTKNPSEMTAERPKGEQANPQTQKAFANPILQAIENAVDNIAEVPEAQPVRGAEVINQIVEQVKVQMNQTVTSMEMQLYPEHLGRIQIHVVSKDGVMTARIVAETEAAKQAVENGLTNLKESMQEQNLKVDAIEVMVSTTGFERGDENQDSPTENQTSNRRRKLDLSEPETDMAEEEAAEEVRMQAAGSSVSYTA